MDSSFAQRLSALRKERKMSQKETAAALGISQALLSHYEKGIRECGLGFVIKASEFYGVTCDYLLGRNMSRHGYTDLLNFDEPLADDSMASLMTCYRASAAMRERIDPEDEELSQKLISIYELGIYLGLNSCVRSGKIPASWLCGSHRYTNNAYLKFASGLLRELFNEGKVTVDNSEEKIPECVETVIKHAEQLIDEKIAKVSAEKTE
ncbi:MAG: helix-turn-helix transcriptional regulator [Clostridiales bacterium]|nr:helix-turn-helix transcriptional regulator [Clostridiales bacterium]